MGWHPFTKAERRAYGALMKAKREREAAHERSAPEGKKTHKPHLYRTFVPRKLQ